MKDRGRNWYVKRKQHLIWKILSLTERACSGEKAQSGSGEAIGKTGFLYFWEENCDHVFFLQEKERMTHSSSRGRDCWGQMAALPLWAQRTTFFQIQTCHFLVAHIGSRKGIFPLLLACSDLKSWVILFPCLYNSNSPQILIFKLVPLKTCPRAKWLFSSFFFLWENKTI